MYPIRCFSCKKVIGNIWEKWFILTEERCITDSYMGYEDVELYDPIKKEKLSSKEIVYNEKVKRKNAKILKNRVMKPIIVDKNKLIKRVLDQYGLKERVEKPHAADLLGLKRQCCRNMVFTSVTYNDL